MRTTFIAAAALLASAPIYCQTRAVVVEAARLVIAPSTVIEGDAARLAFRDGKVVGAGTEIPRDLLESAERVRFAGATIVPGFIVIHDYLELANDLGETISAFTPALDAADAFDPFDEALARHARGGVTSVGLAPASRNTIAGVGSVVQWLPDGGEILEATTYLKVALVAESLDQDRFPTSRMGAADLIRSRFADVAAALAPNDADHRRLSEVLSNQRQLALHARTEAEILEGLALCAEVDVLPILLGANEAGECIEQLRAQGATLALSPLDYTSKRAQLELPAKLEAAGIAFSFLAPHPEQLRRSAGLAVRHGLTRPAALAAMTRVPAVQLRVADRVGSLRRDYRADFAVFSDDPIDLTSKLVAVWIAGQRVSNEESDK